MIAGAALPIFDRMSGAVVVLGEMYRPTGPQDFTALDAAVGQWPVVENGMAQMRKDLKFDHVIVDKEEARRVLWRLPAMSWGMSDIPVVTYAAPPYALNEVGRSNVDRMIAEDRLHLNIVKWMLDQEPDQARLALQAAVNWMRDFKADYKPVARGGRAQGQILGVEGLA